MSKIVKPRCDKFKVWEHIQGQIRTRGRLDYHYFGMYGFMVAKDREQVLDKWARIRIRNSTQNKARIILATRK